MKTIGVNLEVFNSDFGELDPARYIRNARGQTLMLLDLPGITKEAKAVVAAYLLQLEKDRHEKGLVRRRRSGGFPDGSSMEEFW